jgi:hypothetical protein
MTQIDIISTSIAIVAILISVATLYVGYLRSAKLTILPSDHLHIGYYVDIGNLWITLGVGFANDGVRTGGIERLALLMLGPGTDEDFLLGALTFQTVDVAGNFQTESYAGVVAVPGQEVVTKLVHFQASPERPNECQLSHKGTYRFKLLGWTRASEKYDLANSFTVTLNDDDIATLKQYKDNKTDSSIIVYNDVWRQWKAQKLTKAELRELGP